MKAAFVVPLHFFWELMAMAQSVGMLAPTASLTTPRQFHTATLLTNGKVLIAGGGAILNGWPTWASAELYDPATGTFSPTGSMVTARARHTATLLPDGKVLILGGAPSIEVLGFLSSAELYDPSTGSFAATGTPTIARVGHTATLLNDGTVLITGGWNPQTNGHASSLDTAELYDPSTGTFRATGSMIQGIAGHTATLLSDGRVLIHGGYSGTDTTPSPELYDPAPGVFRLTGSSAYPDTYATSASLLPNGKVMTTLQYSCDPSELAEQYDPPTEVFTPTERMTTSRGYSTATLLPEGRVLIAGEDFPGSPGTGSAELYDAASRTFSTGDSLRTQSREGHTTTLLPDGSVLLAGGWVCCGSTIAAAEVYRPAILNPSPVLLSVSSTGQGAILHASTQQLVSSDNAAVAGEALEIYLTGLIEGSAIPPQVVIGGRMAEVLFFGGAPGYPGLNQVNVRVPSGVSPGSGVSVRLIYMTRPSNEVTIGVQ